MLTIISQTTKFLAISLLVCNLSLANAYDDVYNDGSRYGIFDNRDVKESFYMKIGAGAAQPIAIKSTVPQGNIKFKFKTSPLYNVGIGHKVNDYARGDVNLQYTENKAKGSGSAITGQSLSGDLKLRSLALMVNGYCGLPINKTFTPYITAGLGVKKYTRLKDQTKFIWNVGAGTEMNFNNNYGIDLEYRYISSFKKYKSGENRNKDAGHQGLISLVYRPTKA
jgi:opacity protein-like surface antigen